MRQIDVKDPIAAGPNNWERDTVALHFAAAMVARSGPTFGPEQTGVMIRAYQMADAFLDHRDQEHREIWEAREKFQKEAKELREREERREWEERREQSKDTHHFVSTLDELNACNCKRKHVAWPYAERAEIESLHKELSHRLQAAYQAGKIE